MFLAFLGPPTSINSTVNQQKLPFFDPTHPLEWAHASCVRMFKSRQEDIDVSEVVTYVNIGTQSILPWLNSREQDVWFGNMVAFQN
jgi:hypothetical protein